MTIILASSPLNQFPIMSVLKKNGCLIMEDVMYEAQLITIPFVFFNYHKVNK